MYWTYGLDGTGQPSLLGPFIDPQQAQEAVGDLHGARILKAKDRNEAIRQLQKQPAKSRLQSNEPEESDFDKFDREMAESTEI